MKLTDFVIDFLSQNGMDLAFGLTGGAVVHIFDSIEKHPNFNTVFCHHEQAAALESNASRYAKVFRLLREAEMEQEVQANKKGSCSKISKWQTT